MVPLPLSKCGRCAAIAVCEGNLGDNTRQLFPTFAHIACFIEAQKNLAWLGNAGMIKFQGRNFSAGVKGACSHEVPTATDT